MQGVKKICSVEDRSYYEVGDVMNVLGTSKTKSYELIRSTRTALIDEGKISEDYPRGKIPKAAFNSRYMCG